MTDQDPSAPKRTTLKEKLASLHPDRCKKIEDASERMYAEYCDREALADTAKREAVLDELVEDAQKNDMGY
jgi:hypothetical protein